MDDIFIVPHTAILNFFKEHQFASKMGSHAVIFVHVCSGNRHKFYVSSRPMWVLLHFPSKRAGVGTCPFSVNEPKRNEKKIRARFSPNVSLEIGLAEIRTSHYIRTYIDLLKISLCFSECAAQFISPAKQLLLSELKSKSNIKELSTRQSALVENSTN